MRTIPRPPEPSLLLKSGTAVLVYYVRCTDLPVRLCVCVCAHKQPLASWQALAWVT